MTLVKIEVTFAERHMINNILSTLPNPSLDTARFVREWRRRLELRTVAKDVEALTEEARATDTPLDWDDLVEFAPDRHAYTIDNGYVASLLTEMKTRSWAVKGPNGVDIPIPASQLEIIADLEDALLQAKEVKDEQ